MRLGPGSVALAVMLALGCKSKDSPAPVANAGADRTVAAGELATLDGTGSSHEDGKVSKYKWSLVSGPLNTSSVFDNDAAPSPTMSTDMAGNYVISLVVTDKTGIKSSADIVEVTALEADPNRPEARLVATGGLGVNIPVFLDGSLSVAPMGRDLSAWNFELIERPAEAGAEIQLGDDPTQAVLVPDVPGAWIVGLTVNDGAETSRRIGLVLPVFAEANLAPIARCGADQVVSPDSLVTLDGAGSFDPEGQSLSYAWTLSFPDGTSSDLTDSDTDTPQFLADEVGDFVAELVVHDGLLASAPCQSRVRVSENIENQPPVALAGGDQSSAMVGVAISLNGSASYDSDGDTITHDWAILSAPPSSTLSASSLDDSDQPIATLTPDVDGRYVIGLEVCDTEPLCAEDQATVTIDTTSGNNPPQANAGEDQTVEATVQTTLDGSGSFDPDGDTLTYSWSVSAQPDGSIATVDDPTNAVSTFTPDVDGDFVLSLVVDDGMSSDTDMLTIEALPEGTNLPPECDAGEDRISSLGDAVLLDGSATTDPNEDVLAFLWTLLERPDASSVAVDAPTAEITAFTPDVAGEYIVQFQAMDGETNCFVQFTVTVEDDTTPNNPPACITGDDIEVDVGTTAVLDGSESVDPDGDTLVFSWTVADAPSGSAATISDATSDIANFTPDVPGVYTIELNVSDGEADCTRGVTIVANDIDENDPPLCRVSAPSLVSLGEFAAMDASATSDPDGDELFFAWSVVSAPDDAGYSFDDAATALTNWSADTEGFYEILVEVSDGIDTCEERVNVEVTAPINNPPSCDAGGDLTGTIGEVITLDGSGSFDEDGDPLTYQWRVLEQPDGSSATLTDLTLSVASLTPDVAGDFTIRLTVDDGTDSCNTDVTLTIAADNLPPVCEAGDDQSLSLGDTATLDARGSSDPEGDPLTYLWRVLERPDGSTATLTDLTLSVASFTPDVVGDFIIRLTVDDGTDSCSTDITLTVAVDNLPPLCVAGDDQSLTLGETATLDGRASSDPDGDPLTYQWRILERPDDSSATLTDLTLSVASFTPDVVGDFGIRLILSDGTDDCRDDLILSAGDGGGGGTGAPVADAGLPLGLCAIEAVDLDGSGSSDPDGDSLSYTWTFATVPTSSSLSDGDISGASSATPSFTPDAEGRYMVQLEVSDGTASDTDSVEVNVDADSAIVLLHLDEGSGTIASDGSPSGIDGVITEPVWTGGRFFGALDFDGSTFVTIPDEDALDLSDELTIDFWMRTDTVGTTWSAVLTKGTSYNYSMWIYQDELYFYGVTTSLGYVTAGAVATSIGDGQWHHYAAVVNGGTVTVYEDGVAIDTVIYSGTLRTNSTDVFLGRPSYTTSFYMFEGALDEVMIRDVALTDGEVANLSIADTQVCTGDEDTAAPTASIIAPSGGSADIGYVRVEGTASDQSAIVGLTVNEAVAAATDENFSSWVAYVPLSEGSNTLTVRAEDVAGNIATAADSVTVSFTDTCGDGTELLIAFDEESAGTGADDSDNGLDANDGGDASRIIGRFGNALHTEGSGYAQVAHDDAISFGDEFSVELWFRRDGATTDFEVLAHKGDPFNYGVALYTDFLIFGFDGASGGEYFAQVAGFTDGTWHHVVGVYDGADVLLYVDGTLEASVATGGETPSTNTDDLFIGSYAGIISGLIGEVDQLRLYSDALSTSEVIDLFDDGEACPLGDNLATSASASASTTLNPVFTEDNINDGDTSESSSFDYSMWLAEPGEAAWVELDFGRVVGILEVRWANTHNRTTYDRATTDYRILASTSGNFDADAVSIDTGTGALETNLVFHTALPASPVAARYLRFYADDFFGVGAGINEIEVYGLE